MPNNRVRAAPGRRVCCRASCPPDSRCLKHQGLRGDDTAVCSYRRLREVGGGSQGPRRPGPSHWSSTRSREHRARVTVLGGSTAGVWMIDLNRAALWTDDLMLTSEGSWGSPCPRIHSGARAADTVHIHTVYRQSPLCVLVLSTSSERTKQGRRSSTTRGKRNR